MSFISLPPLLSRSEVSNIVKVFDDISSSPNLFYCDTKGGKLSIESHTDAGYNLIFSNNILSTLALRILSPNFLNTVFQYSLASHALSHRGLHSVSKIKPYVHSSTTSEYGDFAPWKTTLKHLHGDYSLLSLLVTSYLNLGILPFQPRLQLSVLPPGSYISPHTDVSNKFMSLMIYLPQCESQLGSNLGTTFYYPRDVSDSLSQSESRHVLDWRDNDWFKHSIQIPTYFGFGSSVMFFRNDTSWHSVTVPMDSSLSRYSININFNIPADLSI